MGTTGARALVFPTGVDEHQLPIAQKMVVPGIMYDQRVLPIIRVFAPVRKHVDDQKEYTALPGRDDGDIRGTLRAAPRTYVLKVRLKIGFGEPRLRKAHRLLSPHPRQPKKKKKNHHASNTLACARALISADAFITSTSYPLFTLRNAPTSGASDLLFDFDSAAATTSK